MSTFEDGKGHVPVGLLDRRLDSLDVERADTAQVDNLSLDALLGENVGRLKTVRDHLAVSDDGDVAALALDLRLANGKQELV